MNDLDRTIAEIKGLDFFDPGLKNSIGIVRPDIKRISDGGPMRIVDVGWSTSDSKALELVDELPGATFFLERYGTKEKTWRAVFDFRQVMVVTPTGAKWFTFDGKAPTRPEAICRAYIAAVTWMREEKG